MSVRRHEMSVRSFVVQGIAPRIRRGRKESAYGDRNGSARWTGDLKTGLGELAVGEGVWTSAYSGRSRFAGVLPGFDDGEGINPEELLAAGQAACFSMALSLGLSDAAQQHPGAGEQVFGAGHEPGRRVRERRRAAPLATGLIPYDQPV